MQWQPMDTAPKDGSEFLAFDSSRIFISRWDEYHPSRPGWGSDKADEYGWAEDPKGWMPLPKRP